MFNKVFFIWFYSIFDMMVTGVPWQSYDIIFLEIRKMSLSTPFLARSLYFIDLTVQTAVFTKLYIHLEH